MRSPFIVFWLWLSFIAPLAAQTPTPSPTALIATPVRIGILSFEDSDDPLSRLRVQAALLLKANPPLRASFAIGSYGEITHWIDNDLIDVAVVNPGLYAQLPKSKWSYLGSAQLEKGEMGYRSVWLARKDSELATISDVLAAGQDLEILAVDPLSVSGFRNPISALQAAGVQIRPNQVRFTYSHNNSLRYLSASSGKQIACVWEPTWRHHPDPALQVVSIPGMDAVRTPPVALIGKRTSEASKIIADLVRDGKFPGFEYDPRYESAIAALPASLPPGLQGALGRPLDRVDLDDLILTMHQHNRSQPGSARLGLVLAGGGAKCSYQAGAVRALEEHLEKARQRLHDDQLDIKLVVGTSGGAINALSVAMGLTRTPEGYADLRGAWGDLDQREIVCPPLAVRINLWCWFASIFGLALLALIHFLGLSRRNALTITALTGLATLIAPRIPIRWAVILGSNANFQHFWTWLSWGVEGAGRILLGAALIGVLMVRIEKRRGKRFHPLVPLAQILTAAVALLPILQGWVMFCYEEVISENYGLEHALTRNFSKLISNETARRQGTAPQPVGSHTIQELSQEVFNRKLLVRDLVLTASPLTDPSVALPGEFYFHASPLGSPPPDFGARGVELTQRPELLFDALLGSAAIYPVFPSRRIENLPTPGQHVDLVDGSFAHRSPLEAAVNWGATHILVIEASTEEVAPRGALIDNFGASLSYLYDEAQLIDVRMRGHTSLYTLYPSAPHIGLLDFSGGLIAASIDKGYREASGAPSAANQKGGALHKEQGPPVFWTP